MQTVLGYSIFASGVIVLGYIFWLITVISREMPPEYFEKRKMDAFWISFLKRKNHIIFLFVVLAIMIVLFVLTDANQR